MSRARVATAPLLTLGVAIASLAALAGPLAAALPCPPSSELGRFASESDPALVAMTAMRMGSLALATYAAAVAALGLMATLAGGRGSRAMVRRVTLPALRRWVLPALAVATVRLAAPAAAGAPPAPPALVMVVDATPSAAPLTMIEEPAVPPPSPAPPAPPTHRVARGDNCWTIAADHLQDTLGQEPSVREVARYWRSLLAVNTDRFTTGDPDLIFPGQELVLPPIDLSASTASH